MSIPGFRAVLMGATGVGKTTSIRTLVDAGITPFVVFMEPRYGVVGDIPEDKLHWHYVPTMVQDLQSMAARTKLLANYLNSPGDREKPRKEKIGQEDQMIEFLKTLNNFKCDRDGKEYGPVSEFGTNKCLVIDGLSGLCEIAWSVAGERVEKNGWTEYQFVQDEVRRKVNWCCVIPKCHFLLIAHVDRVMNEVTGRTLLNPALPGKALTSVFGRNFDEVILAVRQGSKFSWSTANDEADLKASYLPVANGIAPDFGQIIDAWESRGGERK